MRDYISKIEHGGPPAEQGRTTRVSGISLYPHQLAGIDERASKLGLSRSRYMQILADVDTRDKLVRREMARRLDRS